jgi:hypothetical protein
MDAARDANRIPVILGIASDGSGTLPLVIDAATGRALVDVSGVTGLTDTDDLSEGSTNLYFTNERVDDRINALFIEGFGINFTYDDGSDTFTIAELYTPQTLTVSTNAVTPDATYKQHYASHNANITINNPTNADDGKLLLIGIENTSAGEITVTGGNKFRFGSDITSLSNIAAGKINYIGIRYHETDDKWDVISEVIGY